MEIGLYWRVIFSSFLYLLIIIIKFKMIFKILFKEIFIFAKGKWEFPSNCAVYHVCSLNFLIRSLIILK